jgi:hypothetical protein|tara:strand:+ start:888 stop:2576 length:1689 start_codon:yes stop_codon:yes gene_type:complete
MAQLGKAIPQTLEDEVVVSNSNLGPAIPQVMETAIEGGETIPSYLDQIIQNYGARMDEQENITQDWKSGKMASKTPIKGLNSFLSDWNYNAQSFGKTGMGTVVDVAGVAGGAVLDGVKFLLPVTTENIKYAVSNAWDWTINTEGGVQAQEAYAKGEVVYKKFKKENPQAARLFESVVNTALVFSGPKIKAKIGPVEGTKLATTVKKTIPRRLRRSAASSERKDKYERLEEMLSPKVTKETATNLGPGGESLLRDRTLFRGPTLKATGPQQEVLEHLVNVKDVNPKKGATNTKKRVDDYQNKLNDEIQKILKKESSTEIPTQSITGKMTYNIAQVMDEIPELAGKSNSPVVKKYIEAAKTYIKKHGNTPEGIHLARIEFDNYMKRVAGKKVLTPEEVGLNSLLAKEIRNAMNDSIDAIVPLNSVSLRRKKQTLNYRAIDMLAPKISEQGMLLTNLFQNINRVNKTRAGASSAAVLLGTTVFGSPALIATLAGGAGVITATAAVNLLLKTAVSPKTKRMLADTMRETNKALKATKNPAMEASLLAGKALLSDLLLLPVEKEQEK